MISVIVLGTGNVGHHLIQAFEKASTIELKQVYARKATSLSTLKKGINTTSDLSLLKKADVYIIAIADDEIAKFSKKIKLKNSFLVHTSGSVAMGVLDAKHRKGVFYPLQTFSKDKKIEFKNIPICLETEHEKDLTLLKKVAVSISNTVHPINSKQRKSIHLAAVFVNNFVNHLYQIGNEICEEHQVPFKILEPLIQETAKKMIDLSPYEAQTGPARRGDEKTIKAHLQMLSKNEKAVYKLLTQTIKATYGKKL